MSLDFVVRLMYMFLVKKKYYCREKFKVYNIVDVIVTHRSRQTM